MGVRAADTITASLMMIPYYISYVFENGCQN